MLKRFYHLRPMLAVGLALLLTGCEFGATFEDPHLVPLKGGCYQMGSHVDDLNRRDNERLHEVCVEEFLIGKYEVTQKEWRAIMRRNPSRFAKCPDCPVESVSWYDAMDYIERLNERTGKNYRLPTEAEWEYACRAGGQPDRYCGSELADAVAWFANNSDGTPQDVGTRQANDATLHDMSGNVWEWTCSLYDANYTGGEQRCADFRHPGPRVFRGGSWENSEHRLRAAARYRTIPAQHSSTIGLRLAHDVE